MFEKINFDEVKTSRRNHWEIGEMINQIKTGEKNVIVNGTEYRKFSRVTGRTIEAGQILMVNDGANYPAFVQVEGISPDHTDVTTIAYNSVKECMKENNYKNLSQLEDGIYPYIIHTDLENNEKRQSWFYLYNGRWCWGSGAVAVSFTLLEVYDEEKTKREIEDWQRELELRRLNEKRQSYLNQIEYYQNLVKEIDEKIENY